MIGYHLNISGGNERNRSVNNAVHQNFTSSDDGEFGVNPVGKITPRLKARG
jgi:hypothetical protein